jgi:hypothetical protein
MKNKSSTKTPRKTATKVKPLMGGGPMATETGRMAPKSRTIGDRGAGSRTQTRKNTLFDAMKKLV